MKLYSYNSEIYTIGKGEQKRTEAFKWWCFKKMLKKSWMNWITNEKVSEKYLYGTVLK